ncbi:tRNA pseudouridine(13) synthase TruD [Candidatus Woesearchaeota archaeon]|nr:tRNA pseudouridine(13) synthase TruD [Candidatus Woesearchaeota archaeon]
MYRLKQIPEDFVVEEIFTPITQKSGTYAIFELEKFDLSMLKAINMIKEILKCNKIGYAGIKDKCAMTKQYISIFTQKFSLLKDHDYSFLKLKYIGQSDKPISIGDHQGNKFRIVVRNIGDEKITKIEKFKNYFGEQRFSKNNVEVGLDILRGNFKDACKKILFYHTTDEHFNEKFEEKRFSEISVDSVTEQKMLNLLTERNTDFVAALKLIDMKILQLYISAVQSYMFNRILENVNKDVKIPLVGFSSEFEDSEFEDVVFTQMNELNLSIRNFIVRQIPDLTREGDLREAYSIAKNVKISSLKNDELNPDKKKVEMSFELDKGAYATVFISQLFGKQTGFY